MINLPQTLTTETADALNALIGESDSQAVPQNAGSHEALFQRLERSDGQLDYGLKVISKDIAAQLRMLRPLRELASYELGERVRVDQAEEYFSVCL